MAAEKARAIRSEGVPELQIPELEQGEQMNCWNIQPNFKIPRRYQRTFMLSFGPNTHRIRVDRRHGLRYDCFGDFDFEDSGQMNRSLDWIQETIEGVRAEVEE